MMRCRSKCADYAGNIRSLAVAERLWTTINAKNLLENIMPTRPRADLILRKGGDHLVEEVALRKI